MSSPFSITFNAKNPIKPKDVPKQVAGAQSTGATKPMTESEEKLMKQTQSMTDKAIKNQDYPGQYGVIIGEGAPEMSPLNQGGYEGGGDIAGAYYVPKAAMYSEMFSKIGQAIADIGSHIAEKKKGKNKNKKEEENGKSSLCELNPNSTFCNK